ncbi:transposase [Leisingera daeponensis]|uniref:transposase n=1 Tax=Leisingera daeponensis TaxID=405746 RepID=UPI001C94B2E3|nr:transposase [Leisingera daeponensis]MBY6058587.1 transposase [Leisingera daeponensis]
MLCCAAAATHIKKGLVAQEQGKPAVRKARRDWGKRQAIMRASPERLIFLDETGTDTNMTRTHGRCPKGQRLKGSTPFRRWGNQTLIAGLSSEGIVAPWVISGAMDRDAFDAYVEKVLIPELEPGSVVILDNLATHKSDKAAGLLKNHGCWFLYLPPYRRVPQSAGHSIMLAASALTTDRSMYPKDLNRKPQQKAGRARIEPAEPLWRINLSA